MRIKNFTELKLFWKLRYYVNLKRGLSLLIFIIGFSWFNLASAQESELVQKEENPNSNGIMLKVNIPELLFSRIGFNLEIPIAKKYSFVVKPLYLLQNKRNYYSSIQLQVGIKHYYRDIIKRHKSQYYTSVQMSIRKNFARRQYGYQSYYSEVAGEKLKVKVFMGKELFLDNIVIDLYWGPGLGLEKQSLSSYWSQRGGHCIDYEQLSGYKYLITPAIHAGILVGLNIN